jgi:tetratricopeptide (TPR) repeat protein
MSTPPARPPPNGVAHLPGAPTTRQRNGRLPAARMPALDELAERRRRGPELPHKSTDDQRSADRVEREGLHQQLIEATFDRAEAYERLGDFEHALQWLDRAAALSGGLTAAYQSQQARWAQAAALRPEPAAGAWKDDTQRTG